MRRGKGEKLPPVVQGNGSLEKGQVGCEIIWFMTVSAQLQTAIEGIIRSLVRLVLPSITLDYVVEFWRLARVVFILKAGSSSSDSPTDFRSISNTSVIPQLWKNSQIDIYGTP